MAISLHFTNISFFCVISVLVITVPLNLILSVLLFLIIKHATLSSVVTTLGCYILLLDQLLMLLCPLHPILGIKDSVTPAIKS